MRLHREFLRTKRAIDSSLLDVYLPQTISYRAKNFTIVFSIQPQHMLKILHDFIPPEPEIHY